jgi:hypothetical protein
MCGIDTTRLVQPVHFIDYIIKQVIQQHFDSSVCVRPQARLQVESRLD